MKPSVRSAPVLTLALLVMAGCTGQVTDSTPEGIAGPLAAPGGGGGGPTVTTFDPKSGEQGTTLDLHVVGTNYDNGSRVDLLLNGKTTPKVKTNSTTLVPGTTTDLIANVTIATDALITDYEVQVTAAGGKKGIGIEKFAVLERSNPGQWVPPILDATFGQGSGGTDAVRADDLANTTYVGGAHIAVNGNLSFLGFDAPRPVRVESTAFDGSTRDRIFTNNHSNPGGDNSFGLLGMVNGSTGTAVFAVELNVDNSDPYDVIRYGTDCTAANMGTPNVPANLVVVTRSADGRTWTITGTRGIHCRQIGKKPVLSQVGTAGPFSLTLVMQ